MVPLASDDRRLRADAPGSPFHVVLVEPEIPPNTGNIARLCAATRTPLHLVGRLGFSIDEHAVRRAGLDYWHLVDLHTHQNLEAFERTLGPNCRQWLLSGRAERSYLDVHFEPSDTFVFGRESAGLPLPLLEQHPDRVIGIPMLGEVRSLNLANAVAIVLFEALRQARLLDTHSQR
jgi:tRNA (cytidine/uridine-2'-O-)-methyltransferase